MWEYTETSDNDVILCALQSKILIFRYRCSKLIARTFSALRNQRTPRESVGMLINITQGLDVISASTPCECHTTLRGIDRNLGGSRPCVAAHGRLRGAAPETKIQAKPATQLEDRYGEIEWRGLWSRQWVNTNPVTRQMETKCRSASSFRFIRNSDFLGLPISNNDHQRHRRDSRMCHGKD